MDIKNIFINFNLSYLALFIIKLKEKLIILFFTHSVKSQEPSSSPSSGNSNPMIHSRIACSATPLRKVKKSFMVSLLNGMSYRGYTVCTCSAVVLDVALASDIGKYKYYISICTDCSRQAVLIPLQ